MFSIKKKGFTLSETLITLGIVGIVSILVLPGIIKDSANRAMMTLTQNIVTSLESAIENELLIHNTKSLLDTSFDKNPEEFLRKYFDVDEIKSGQDYYTETVNTINGNFSAVFRDIGSTDFIYAKLKNGAIIGYSIPNPGRNRRFMFDVNGVKSPNTAGLDVFEGFISQYPADTVSFTNVKVNTGIDCEENRTLESSLNLCKTEGQRCLCSLIRSGYDPNYLKD